MDLQTTLKLLDAGYTKEEIDKMNSVTSLSPVKPVTPPEPEKEPEPMPEPDKLEEIYRMIKVLYDAYMAGAQD